MQFPVLIRTTPIRAVKDLIRIVFSTVRYLFKKTSPKNITMLLLHNNAHMSQKRTPTIYDDTTFYYLFCIHTVKTVHR